MKSKFTRRLVSLVLFSLALVLNINNLTRHPGNKLRLLSVVAFAIVIGALANDLIKEYSQKKKDEAEGQF